MTNKLKLSSIWSKPTILHSHSNSSTNRLPVKYQSYKRNIRNYTFEPISFNRFISKRIFPQNTDLMAYVNTKFVYLGNILYNTMTTLYTAVIKKTTRT